MSQVRALPFMIIVAAMTVPIVFAAQTAPLSRTFESVTREPAA
jgi:hypothetical protein